MRAGVPAGLGRCWAGRLGAGFGLYMTLTAKRQASGRKSSSFCPFSLRVLLLSLFGCPRVLLLALSLRSGRASWRHRGGGRRVRLAGVLGVSCSSAAWGRAGRSLVPCLLSVSPAGRAGAVCAGAGACAGHGRRSQAKRLANRQNAQRFNKKCSIMTKMMGCILYFLRYKYVCFGVK